MIALLLERGDADATPRGSGADKNEGGAEGTGGAGGAEGTGGAAGGHAEQRHGVLCVLIIDSALAVSRRADESCGADALRIGRRMPIVLRKIAKLGGVALGVDGPGRQYALDAADMLARATASAQREAAFLLAEARASELELDRVDSCALLDALIRRAQWAAAERLAELSEMLRRRLIDGCVRAREHKRAHGYVCAFGWSGRAEYEPIHIHLEMGRVIWLVRSGHVDLVRGALRDAVEALCAFGAAAPGDACVRVRVSVSVSASASASVRVSACESARERASEPLVSWPLSEAGTVELVRQMLRKMAEHHMDLEQMDDAHDEDAPAASARAPAQLDEREPPAQTAVCEQRTGRAVWLVRALCPPWHEEHVSALWHSELSALAQLAAASSAPTSGAQPACSLRLPLDDAQVQLVESAAAVEAMVAQLEAERSASGERGVVGFDSEWRATGFLRQTRCALLQLASARAVWLLDLHALFLRPANATAAAVADRALVRLFENAEITKLAFGLREELRTLHSSYPHLVAFEPTTMRAAVCVRELYASSCAPSSAAQLDRRAARKQRADGGGDASGAVKAERRAARKVRADDGGDGAEDDADADGEAPGEQVASQAAQSLSAICAVVLGGKLDKTSQMSDWERRPLTAAQRHYAALDAHCLIELYARISRSLGAGPHACTA